MEDLVKRARIQRLSFSLKQIDEYYFEFFAKLRKRRTRGRLNILGREVWVFVLTERENGSSAREVMTSVLQRLYPIVIRPIISVRSYFSILDNFARMYKVEVEEFLLRKRKAGETSKRWTSKIYEEAKKEILSDMRDKRLVVDAVRLFFKYMDKQASIKFDRFGLITIYDALPLSFIEIYHYLMVPFIEAVLEEYRELKKVKREEIVEIGGVMRPLLKIARLKFIRHRIDVADFERLINTLEEHFYVSVYHLGNPWLHLSVIDNGNGSSFEIIATPSEAQIIPVIKASSTSLKLIIDAFNSVVPEISLTVE